MLLVCHFIRFLNETLRLWLWRIHMVNQNSEPFFSCLFIEVFLNHVMQYTEMLDLSTELLGSHSECSYRLATETIFVLIHHRSWICNSDTQIKQSCNPEWGFLSLSLSLFKLENDCHLLFYFVIQCFTFKQIHFSLRSFIGDMLLFYFLNVCTITWFLIFLISSQDTYTVIGVLLNPPLP